MQLADGSAASTLLGTGREAGADEVDFHSFGEEILKLTEMCEKKRKYYGLVYSWGSSRRVVGLLSNQKKVLYF